MKKVEKIIRKFWADFTLILTKFFIQVLKFWNEFL